jgi:hypothetical protein
LFGGNGKAYFGVTADSNPLKHLERQAGRRPPPRLSRPKSATPAILQTLETSLADLP